MNDQQPPKLNFSGMTDAQKRVIKIHESNIRKDWGRKSVINHIPPGIRPPENSLPNEALWRELEMLARLTVGRVTEVQGWLEEEVQERLKRVQGIEWKKRGQMDDLPYLIPSDVAEISGKLRKGGVRAEKGEKTEQEEYVFDDWGDTFQEGGKGKRGSTKEAPDEKARTPKHGISREDQIGGPPAKKTKGGLNDTITIKEKSQSARSRPKFTGFPGLDIKTEYPGPRKTTGGSTVPGDQRRVEKPSSKPAHESLATKDKAAEEEKSEVIKASSKPTGGAESKAKAQTQEPQPTKGGRKEKSAEKSRDKATTAKPLDQNDDECNKCGEGGTLVCCETCTRSFHFECCEPPEKRPLPKIWSCHICKPRASTKTLGKADTKGKAQTGKAQPLNDGRTEQKKTTKEDQGKATSGGAKPVTENDSTCSKCPRRGTLICCDTCPRSFHPLCCEPPLIKRPYPEPWSCHVCEGAKKSENTGRER